MKKILLGFIAIGFITFYGCDKDDDADTETSTETKKHSPLFVKTRECECEMTFMDIKTEYAVEYKGKCKDLAKEYEGSAGAQDYTVKCHER